MTTASSAGMPQRWRLLRLRTRERAAAGGWCSCGHLPTEHAQRVRLDFFFILDYRQPIGIFVHRAVALRALPDDLQSPVLYFEAPAQISAGNANIAVRDIAFRAGRACGASSNGSAKTVPVWLSCGLHAGCATEGGDHAATCCCLRDAGSATSLPAVMTCNWHWRRYGTSLPQTYVASLEMPKAPANSWRPPKCLIAV